MLIRKVFVFQLFLIRHRSFTGIAAGVAVVVEQPVRLVWFPVGLILLIEPRHLDGVLELAGEDVPHRNDAVDAAAHDEVL